MTETTAPAPLDEVMLAMDVVDTLRHRQDLAVRELDGSARGRQLIEKLRDIYRQQGIEVSDDILRQGVEALAHSRFVYDPPKPGLATTLAKVYVTRGRWGRIVGGAVLGLGLGLGGYYLGYKPYIDNQAAAAQLELTQGLPARLDGLYQTIYTETKVQAAEAQAKTLQQRGKDYVAEGDRAKAEDMVARMTALRDQLRLEYTLRVVNRQGGQSGFWTFPESNTAATNYYIVVEAIDADGNALTLPVANEENGTMENVALWGLRVPEAVYNSVVADKRDNGIIDHAEVGRKSDGFLDVDYGIPVLGGTVTRW